MKKIELKLALLDADPASLTTQLTNLPMLAKRKFTHRHLHTTYFDTPNHHLRKAKMALQLRRFGTDVRPLWVQTYETGDQGDSALSQRGEWGKSLAGDALEQSMLQNTPWADFDPDGAIFGALQVCFVADFEQTLWQVRKRDGSKVEIWLDIGYINIGNKTTPICELKLALCSGQPAALFAVARTIAHSMSVMPLTVSKAARGYALAQNALELPRRAQPPRLARALTLTEAAPCVLKEMFFQFTTNLVALRTSDDLEVVHQARVGWRRFKSALRLFKPILNPDTRPSLQPLQKLLDLLSELRELDVVRTDTLPPLHHAFTNGESRRTKVWQAMTRILAQTTSDKRQALRHALHEPILGTALLGITQWLETRVAVNAHGSEVIEQQPALTHWARRRLVRLHAQLKLALQAPANVENLHLARIAAKRQRYAIDTLRPLLHRKRAKRWYRHALTLQNDLGAERDLVRAGEILGQLKVDRGVVEFLRGVAAGKI